MKTNSFCILSSVQEKLSEPYNIKESEDNSNKLSTVNENCLEKYTYEVSPHTEITKASFENKENKEDKEVKEVKEDKENKENNKKLDNVLENKPKNEEMKNNSKNFIKKNLQKLKFDKVIIQKKVFKCNT
jgi:hypothetical protein